MTDKYKGKKKKEYTCEPSRACNDMASSPSLQYEHTCRSEIVSSKGLFNVSGNNKLRSPDKRPVAPNTM